MRAGAKPSLAFPPWPHMIQPPPRRPPQPITPGVISPKEGGVGEELRRRSFEEQLE